MTREAKILWVAFAILSVAFVAVALTSCGGSVPPAKRIQAVSCLDLANAALGEAQSCEQARAALARAVGDAPQCAAIFGLHLALEEDGGPPIRCDD